MCFTHVSFFHEFWVALSALWDRLTCNPSTYMQSKHAFQLLHFFLKKASWRPSNESLFERFLTNCVIFVWKNGFQKLLQKKVPLQSQILFYLQARRLPERQPWVRTVQTKNSCSSNSWSTVSDFCRKKWTGLKIGVKKWLDSWIVAKKTEWTVDFWKLRQV